MPRKGKKEEKKDGTFCQWFSKIKHAEKLDTYVLRHGIRRWVARKCQRSYNLKQAFAGLCLFEEKERAGNTHIHEGDDNKDDGGNGDDSDGNSSLKHWCLAGGPKNEKRTKILIGYKTLLTLICRNCYLSKQGYFVIQWWQTLLNGYDYVYSNFLPLGY